MNFIFSKIGGALSALAIIASVLAWVHHNGAKSELAKIQKSNAAIVLKIQGEKDAINSRNHSDSASVKRLLAGSF